MSTDLTFPYRIIDTSPLIVVTFWYRDTGAVVEDIRTKFPKHDQLYVLCQLWWQHESQEQVKSAKAIHEGFVKKYPNVEWIILCNTRKEVENLTSAGISCVYCNHNAFVDETIFTILPGKNKEYDAIYSARLHASKRHYLATKIEKIALITYGNDEDRRRYLKEIWRLLPNATFLNFYSNGVRAPYVWLSTAEVANALNKTSVGLCLSAEEGASYASMEYLLCGLPIVSTKSIGGRDVFYDDEFVRIVDDTPEAVARGVEEMIQANIPPEFARERTLEKISSHRERFCDLLETIYQREKVTKDTRSIWEDIFVDKLGLRWIGPDSPPEGTLFAPVRNSHLDESE